MMTIGQFYFKSAEVGRVFWNYFAPIDFFFLAGYHLS